MPNIRPDLSGVLTNMRCAARLLASTSRPLPTQHLPPAFLLPSFYVQQSAQFSQTSSVQARQDGNKKRGVSALRRTGLRKRQTLSVDPAKLPRPVLDPAMRSKVVVDDDHGLWQFFNPERTPFATPDYNISHGRGWTVNELRNKDFQDLWSLWWVCVKERNRITTEEYERQRVMAGYGEYEATDRDREVCPHFLLPLLICLSMWQPLHWLTSR